MRGKVRASDVVQVQRMGPDPQRSGPSWEQQGWLLLPMFGVIIGGLFFGIQSMMADLTSNLDESARRDLIDHHLFTASVLLSAVPFMAWATWQMSGMYRWATLLAIVSGIATGVFNVLGLPETMTMMSATGTMEYPQSGRWWFFMYGMQLFRIIPLTALAIYLTLRFGMILFSRRPSHKWDRSLIGTALLTATFSCLVVGITVFGFQVAWRYTGP